MSDAPTSASAHPGLRGALIRAGLKLVEKETLIGGQSTIERLWVGTLRTPDGQAEPVELPDDLSQWSDQDPETT